MLEGDQLKDELKKFNLQSHMWPKPILAYTLTGFRDNSALISPKFKEIHLHCLLSLQSIIPSVQKYLGKWIDNALCFVIVCYFKTK